MKIDNRKNYYLTIDTETANGLDDPLMYDIGGAIHDKNGNIYESFSFIIADIYCNTELFKTAYYANKRPHYEDGLKNGTRKMVSIFTAKNHIANLCKKYNVKAIIAYNARFDYSSTQKTLRYATKSAFRWFLPYGIPVWDSWKMAQDTICKQANYRKFCEKNNLFTANGRLKTSAEAVYRYITKDELFDEEHTGFEDVLVEIAIFAKCMAQHKPMRTVLYA